MKCKKLLFCLAIFQLVGCTTWSVWERKEISRPVVLNINVNSEPTGAKVYERDVFKGITPVTLQLTATAYKRWYERNLISSKGEKLQTEKTWPGSGAGRYGTHEIAFCKEDAIGPCYFPTVNVTVYKAGYGRKQNSFTLFQNPVNEYWNDKLVTLYTNWTAFLEPEQSQDRAPSQQQQQQQQQQIIIEKTKTISQLTVTSEPSNAEVYLDNKFIGTTPIDGMKIKPGSYRLKVVKGDRSWERTILLPEEGVLKINAKLK